MTTRFLPNQASSEISGQALRMNFEIGGTRAKGRLFQLTRGLSVQRFKDACSDPERVVSVARPGIYQQEEV